jgi:8-oxo-dGTP diphosphatase
VSAPVPLNRAERLLRLIELERVSVHIRAPLTYAGFSTEALLRMHLLPYLLPLKSERALAFEVAERPQLQAAVGLKGEPVPTRATLWHFRRRNAGAFRSLMTRALALIAVEGVATGLDLPFVRSMHHRRGATVGFSDRDVFVDPRSQTRITVMSRSVAWPSPKPPAEPRLPGMETAAPAKAPKLLLHEALDLPVVIRWRNDGRAVSRYLVQPSWLETPLEVQDLGAYFGRDKATPYTACNVIVLQKMNGSDHILLCKRLRGTGVGSYTLPGGKKNPAESVLACVKRELQEEIGIDYRSGKPVSLRTTRRRGFPPVTSIGVVATNWRGIPRRREHLQHSEWRWFGLNDLPSPLFFPTQIAINDYLNNRFPELGWDDVEEDAPLPLWRAGDRS